MLDMRSACSVEPLKGTAAVRMHPGITLAVTRRLSSWRVLQLYIDVGLRKLGLRAATAVNISA
jgi:hypothetical protein